MKLNASQTKDFLKKPDFTCAGYLIYGPDSLLVSYGRDQLANRLLNSGSDIAFERVGSEKLTGNCELLASLIKAQGFFANRRVICVDGAGDGAVEAASIALKTHSEDDGWLLMTAGLLRPASKLRKLFEMTKNAVSAPIYDASLTLQEVKEVVQSAGIEQINRDAMEDLTSLGRNLAPQLFAQTVEKISLYKFEDNSPLSSADIEACALRDEDGSIDDLMSFVLNQKPTEIGPALRQVYGRGQNPVTILIMAQREFRKIFSAACDSEGAVAGVGRLKPPVFGPRRAELIRTVSQWGIKGAETALSHLIVADRQLRSSGGIPAQAVVERTLMRLSLLRLS